MKHLSKRQSETFEFISDIFSATGKSPTLREVRDFLGIKSVGSARNIIEILVRKGYLQRDKYRYRGIRMTRSASGQMIDALDTVAVPLIEPRNLVGPIICRENIERFLSFDRHLVQGKDVFCLRAPNAVKGVEKGDIVLVSAGSKPTIADTILELRNAKLFLRVCQSKEYANDASYRGKAIGMFKKLGVVYQSARED